MKIPTMFKNATTITAVIVVWTALWIVLAKRQAAKEARVEPAVVTFQGDYVTNKLMWAWNDGFNAGESALMFSTRYVLTNGSGDRVSIAASNLVMFRKLNPYLK